MSVIQAEACKVRDPLINGFSYDELNIGDVAYFVNLCEKCCQCGP